jgi:hypothetical protein
MPAIATIWEGHAAKERGCQRRAEAIANPTKAIRMAMEMAMPPPTRLTTLERAPHFQRFGQLLVPIDRMACGMR